MSNKNESMYAVSKETALSVKDNNDNKIAVNNGAIPTPEPKPQKKQLPEAKTEPAKKKNYAGLIIMIVVIVLLAAAAVFFGYKYFTDKASKEILADLTGTWIYDTGSETPGYVSFLGNEQTEVNGVSYSVTADKNKLVFQRGSDEAFGVEYSRNGEQLMLALDVGNKLFGEECTVTASPSDLKGILLYRISDSHSLAEEDIKAAYLDRFPQYITYDLNDLWNGIMNGEVDFDDISGYLPEIDSAEDLLDIYNQFTGGEYGEYIEGILGEGFDPSDYVYEYFSGLGEEVGGYIAGEIDGTETEEIIGDLYQWWQMYEDIQEGDYDSIMDYYGDWDLYGDWDSYDGGMEDYDWDSYDWSDYGW